MQRSATVFSQITSALFPAEFSRCTDQFPTTRPTRGLTSYDPFLALCFGQLTCRESLRDVVACLKARGSGLYHLGFRGHLSPTNLAYAGRHRDGRLFQALAQILMRRAARLYQDHPIDPALPRVAFALDSSIISLSLNLFPWGYYARSKQSALKLHLLLSLQGNLPAWGALTQAGFPDMKILDRIPVRRGAYYVMDRGYLYFIRLDRLHPAGGFFVVRNKHHVKFRVLGGVEDHVHLFFGLKRTRTIADVVERVKTSSSKWIKTKGAGFADFHWQLGYGAFSVSQSDADAVVAYIRIQAQHHQKMTFQDEYRRLLERYQVAFDEKYVWD